MFDGDKKFGKEDTLKFNIGGIKKLNFYPFYYPFLIGIFSGIIFSGFVLIILAYFLS